MAFISYEQREDFQDDTFKVVAALVVEAIKAQVEKDTERLFSSTDAIYTILHKRVKNTDGYNEKLERVRVSLYARDNADGLTKSKLYDSTRLLWKELAGALDDAGLLLRERIDKSEVVTRE